MEANGNSTGFQTAHVSGGLVLVALLGLILLNRATLNVSIGR
jgi:hypothetical protein